MQPDSLLVDQGMRNRLGARQNRFDEGGVSRPDYLAAKDVEIDAVASCFVGKLVDVRTRAFQWEALNEGAKDLLGKSLS